MNILGLETSSIVCSVGLVNDNGFSVERSLVDPHIHSEKLLTLVEEVLRQSELGLQNIDALAVSIGPGSFTGLRIGLSTAKGICVALDKPLIAIPTFESVARLAWEDKPGCARVAIALDAKQGQFYVAMQDRKDKGSAVRVAVRSLDPDAVRSTDNEAPNGIWITDRTDMLLSAGVPANRSVDYIVLCGGRTVAAMGLESFRRKEFANVSSLEPMYLKEFLVKTATT